MTASDEPTPARPGIPDATEDAENAKPVESTAPTAQNLDPAATEGPAEAEPGYVAHVPPGYGVYPVPTPKTPFWSRVLSMRAVAAVALAGLILGGAGGTAVGLAAGHDDDRGRVDRDRFGPVLQLQPAEGQQGFPDQGFPGQPPGQLEQLPPATEPDQSTG